MSLKIPLSKEWSIVLSWTVSVVLSYYLYPSFTYKSTKSTRSVCSFTFKSRRFLKIISVVICILILIDPKVNGSLAAANYLICDMRLDLITLLNIIHHFYRISLATILWHLIQLLTDKEFLFLAHYIHWSTDKGVVVISIIFDFCILHCTLLKLIWCEYLWCSHAFLTSTVGYLIFGCLILIFFWTSLVFEP